jgi:hypothetical protein
MIGEGIFSNMLELGAEKRRENAAFPRPVPT